jgi:hypothetical protein
MHFYTDFLFLTLTILVLKVGSAEFLMNTTYIGNSVDCLSHPEKTKHFYVIDQDVSLPFKILFTFSKSQNNLSNVSI